RDADRAIELLVVALPWPSYGIREARCRSLTGALDAGAVAGIAKLGGAQMVGGLTRRVAELTGNGAGSGLVLAAVVDVARLARQTATLPRGRAERTAGAASAAW